MSTQQTVKIRKQPRQKLNLSRGKWTRRAIRFITMFNSKKPEERDQARGYFSRFDFNKMLKAVSKEGDKLGLVFETYRKGDPVRPDCVY